MVDKQKYFLFQSVIHYLDRMHIFIINWNKYFFFI